MRFFFSISFLLLLCSCTSQTFVEEESPPSSLIIASEFGLFERGLGEELLLVVADRISNVTGQIYGWRIKLDISDEWITLREEMQLPERPQIWNIEKHGTSISQDGKTSVIEKEVQPSNGWISNAWQVATGDPSGEYTIRIYINDRLLETFNFVLEEKDRGGDDVIRLPK